MTESAGGPGDHGARPGRGTRWRLDVSAVLLYLALGALFSAVPRHVVEDLDGTKALAGLSVSIFFIAAILTRPLVGKLVDRHGRRPFLMAAPLVITAVMFGFHLGGGIPVVLALRFVQGIAGSAFYVAAVTASTDLAPAHRRASAVARLSLAIYLGFAVGPALGETLANISDAVTWNVLAGVAAAGALVALTIPETRDPAAGAAITATSRGAGRLIHPAAVLPGLCLLTLGVGYASITAQSTQYARAIGLDNASELYIVYAGSILGVRLVSGQLADRFGNVRVMFPGIFTLAAGLAILALFPHPGTAVLGVALVGIGWALVFPAVMAWLSDIVADAERGAAVGSAVAFMDVGQGFGGYAVGAVADAAGFGWAYALPSLLALGGAAVMASAVRRVEAAPAAAPA